MIPDAHTFTALCRENCVAQIPNGPCTLCRNGFAPPDCCNCPPPLTEIDGVCSEFLKINFHSQCIAD